MPLKVLNILQKKMIKLFKEFLSFYKPLFQILIFNVVSLLFILGFLKFLFAFLWSFCLEKIKTNSYVLIFFSNLKSDWILKTTILRNNYKYFQTFIYTSVFLGCILTFLGFIFSVSKMFFFESASLLFCLAFLSWVLLRFYVLFTLQMINLFNKFIFLLIQLYYNFKLVNFL